MARDRGERGVTLIELTIVVVIATAVMVGLTAFYFNAQTVWIDASSQALAQREASMLIEAIARETRRAAHAVVENDPDANRQSLELIAADAVTRAVIACDAGDSLVVLTDSLGRKRPLTSHRARRMRFVANDTLVVVELIELGTGNARAVRTGTAIALRNRP
jgi:Tfp pilus assembly protein FimT